MHRTVGPILNKRSWQMFYKVGEVVKAGNGNKTRTFIHKYICKCFSNYLWQLFSNKSLLCLQWLQFQHLNMNSQRHQYVFDKDYNLKMPPSEVNLSIGRVRQLWTFLIFNAGIIMHKQSCEMSIFFTQSKSFDSNFTPRKSRKSLQTFTKLR